METDTFKLEGLLGSRTTADRLGPHSKEWGSQPPPPLQQGELVDIEMTLTVT